MSGKKKVSPSPAGNADQARIGNFSPSKKRFKLKIIGLGLIIVIVVIGFALIWHFHVQANNKKVAQAQTAAIYQQNVDNVTKQLAKGSPGQSIQELSYVLTLPLNNVQKFNVLSELGLAYFETGNFNKSLSLYRQAESSDSSMVNAGTLALMAGLYQQNGDKTNAVIYYKKAIARAQSKAADPADGANLPGYENALNQLGGST